MDTSNTTGTDRFGAAVPRRRRGGFTFAEVMFAVVILGIGFIMIAAVFPVAIKLNQQSSEGTQGVLVAQQAVQAIAAQAGDSSFPPTYKYNSTASPTAASMALKVAYACNLNPPVIGVGEAATDDSGSSGSGPQVDVDTNGVPSVGDKRVQLAAATWTAMRGSLLPGTDRRMGVAMAYSRIGPPGAVSGGLGSPVAKLFLITAQVRGDRPTFNDRDTTFTTGTVQISDATLFQQDTKIPFGPVSTNNGDPSYAAWGASALEAMGRSYTGGAVTYTSGSTPATLQFKRQAATLFYGTNIGEPDVIKILKLAPGNGGTGDISAAAEGAFVIVARPNVANGSGAGAGSVASYVQRCKFNGYVFRLGKQIAETATSVSFQLVQGQDVASYGYNTTQVAGSAAGKVRDALCAGSTATAAQTVPPNSGNVYEVLFLGRALQTPSQAWNASTNPYVGPPMDVSVYTTTIGLSK